jgi:hypothetical protein
MYNVVKVVNLVRDFCASCQRHGLCDEATFPQNFVSIIGELEQYVRACIYLFHCSFVSCFFFLEQRVFESGPGSVSMPRKDEI